MVSFAFWDDHSFSIVKEKWAADNIRSMGQWGSLATQAKMTKPCCEAGEENVREVRGGRSRTGLPSGHEA